MPRLFQALDERFGHEQDGTRGYHEKHYYHGATLCSWQRPYKGRGPDQLSLHHLRLEVCPYEQQEQGAQDEGVCQVKLAPEHYGESVESGYEQDRQGRRYRSPNGKALLPGLEPVDEYHQAPANPDEESVRPGHVGRGETYVLGDVGRSPGQVDVDGVFRQDRHNCQHGDGQCPWNVHLRHFQRP